MQASLLCMAFLSSRTLRDEIGFARCRIKRPNASLRSPVRSRNSSRSRVFSIAIAAGLAREVRAATFGAMPHFGLEACRPRALLALPPVIKRRAISAPRDEERLWLSLGSDGRTPEGTGIGEIGIKRQHLVIELPRGFSLVIQLNEVADVLARFFDISGTIIVAGNFVSANNRRWFQGVDLVERGNPFQPRLSV